MNYEIDIEYTDDLIRVCTSGAADSRDSFELMSRIVKACKEHNCYKVLTKSGLKAMSIMTVFDHVKMYEELEMTKNKYRIAWFVADPDMREKVEDIAAMLRNRDLVNGFVFSDYADAQEWLLEEEF